MQEHPVVLQPALAAEAEGYEDRPCPLCDHPERSVLVSRPFAEAGRLYLVRCRACGMMYSAPCVTPAHRLALYRRSAHQAGRSACFDWTHQSTDLDLYARAIGFLGSRLGQAAVLDFGCGGGVCMLLWQRLLPQLDVRGCSFDPAEVQAAARATGRPVYPLAELDRLASGRFAAVTLFNVLEHVLDPRPTLRRLRRLVAPDGWLLVVVPNTWTFRQRLRLAGDGGRDLALHEHVNHFTPESLVRCLAAAGWRLDRWLDDLPRGVQPASGRVSPRQWLRHGVARCTRRWTGRPSLFANLWAVARPAEAMDGEIDRCAA